MGSERTYSTREVAQMWNVSESTIKRWADDFGLRCFRTPGGHRRFSLQDIYEFQQQRAFEATGMLTTEEWEDPDLELWLNSRKYPKVRDLLLYLATHNQRLKLKCLLERLYLRGMRLEDIYEEIIAPLFAVVEETTRRGELSPGQALLVKNNLEGALLNLSPKIIRRSPHGKTALCAAPTRHSRLAVAVLSQLLEIEGWETLNLGDEVPFTIMSEIVQIEPINLVCLYFDSECAECASAGSSLSEVAKSFRIPLLIASRDELGESVRAQLLPEAEFSDFRAVRRFLVKAAR